MNERERADWLARAIDDLLRGTQLPAPEDEDQQSLLDIARSRLKAAKDAAREGADHEDAVWQQLVARFDARASRAQPPSEQDVLGDAIAQRREHTHALTDRAEDYRDDVWVRVQQRIADTSRPPLRQRLFGWLRTPQRWPEGETPPASRTRLVPNGDTDIDGLIRVALARPPLRVKVREELDETNVRVRERMRNDPTRRPLPSLETDPGLRPGFRPFTVIGGLWRRLRRG